jgi:hypothetical protein
MRIRGLFFFRRYHIPTFINILLLFGLVLMSLRVKRRQGVAFLDALLLEVTSPAQKVATLVIKIVNLGNVQINNKEVQLPPSKYRKSTEYHYYWINGV